MRLKLWGIIHFFILAGLLMLAYCPNASAQVVKPLNQSQINQIVVSKCKYQNGCIASALFEACKLDPTCKDGNGKFCQEDQQCSEDASYRAAQIVEAHGDQADGERVLAGKDDANKKFIKNILTRMNAYGCGCDVNDTGHRCECNAGCVDQIAKYSTDAVSQANNAYKAMPVCSDLGFLIEGQCSGLKDPLLASCLKKNLLSTKQKMNRSNALVEKMCTNVFAKPDDKNDEGCRDRLAEKFATQLNQAQGRLVWEESLHAATQMVAYCHTPSLESKVAEITKGIGLYTQAIAWSGSCEWAPGKLNVENGKYTAKDPAASKAPTYQTQGPGAASISSVKVKPPKNWDAACAINSAVQARVKQKYGKDISLCDPAQMKLCTQDPDNINLPECKNKVAENIKKNCEKDAILAEALKLPVCGKENIAGSSALGQSSVSQESLGLSLDPSSRLSETTDHNGSIKGIRGSKGAKDSDGKTRNETNDSFINSSGVGGEKSIFNSKKGYPWGAPFGQKKLTPEEEEKERNAFNNIFVATYKDPLCKDLVKKVKTNSLGCDVPKGPLEEEQQKFKKDISAVSDFTLKREATEWLIRKYSKAYLDLYAKSPGNQDKVNLECSDSEFSNVITKIKAQAGPPIKKGSTEVMDKYAEEGLKKAKEVDALDKSIQAIMADFGDGPKGESFEQIYSRLTFGLGPCVSAFSAVDGFASDFKEIMQTGPVGQCSKHQTEGTLGIIQTDPRRNQCERPSEDDPYILQNIKALGKESEKDKIIKELQKNWDEHLDPSMKTASDQAVEDIWAQMQKDDLSAKSQAANAGSDEGGDQVPPIDPNAGLASQVASSLQGIWNQATGERNPSYNPSQIKQLKGSCWVDKCKVKNQVLSNLIAERTKKLAEIQELRRKTDKEGADSENGTAFYKHIASMSDARALNFMKGEMNSPRRLEELKALSALIKEGCSNPQNFSEHVFLDDAMFEAFLKEKAPQSGNLQTEFVEMGCEVRKGFSTSTLKSEDGSYDLKSLAFTDKGKKQGDDTAEAAGKVMDLMSCVPIVGEIAEVAKGGAAFLGKGGLRKLAYGKLKDAAIHAVENRTLGSTAAEIGQLGKNKIIALGTASKQAILHGLKPSSLGIAMAMTSYQSYRQYGGGLIDGAAAMFGLKQNGDVVGEITKTMADCRAGIISAERCEFIDSDMGKFWAKTFVANQILGSLAMLPFEGKPATGSVEMFDQQANELHKKAIDSKNPNLAESRKNYSDYMAKKLSKALSISERELKITLFDNDDKAMFDYFSSMASEVPEGQSLALKIDSERLHRIFDWNQVADEDPKAARRFDQNEYENVGNALATRFEHGQDFIDAHREKPVFHQNTTDHLIKLEGLSQPDKKKYKAILGELKDSVTEQQKKAIDKAYYESDYSKKRQILEQEGKFTPDQIAALSYGDVVGNIVETEILPNISHLQVQRPKLNVPFQLTREEPTVTIVDQTFPNKKVDPALAGVYLDSEKNLQNAKNLSPEAALKQRISIGKHASELLGLSENASKHITYEQKLILLQDKVNGVKNKNYSWLHSDYPVDSHGIESSLVIESDKGRFFKYVLNEKGINDAEGFRNLIPAIDQNPELMKKYGIEYNVRTRELILPDEVTFAKIINNLRSQKDPLAPHFDIVSVPGPGALSDEEYLRFIADGKVPLTNHSSQYNHDIKDAIALMALSEKGANGLKAKANFLLALKNDSRFKAYESKIDYALKNTAAKLNYDILNADLKLSMDIGDSVESVLKPGDLAKMKRSDPKTYEALALIAEKTEQKYDIPKKEKFVKGVPTASEIDANLQQRKIESLRKNYVDTFPNDPDLLVKTQKNFNPVSKEKNIDFIKNINNKKMLFFHVEYVPQREHNNFVIEEKDVVTAMGNIYKKLLLYEITQSPEIRKHAGLPPIENTSPRGPPNEAQMLKDLEKIAPFDYSDYKSLRIAFEGDTPELRKAISDAYDKSRIDFTKWVEKTPEIREKIKTKGHGLAQDADRFFGGGISVGSADTAAISSRSQRSHDMTALGSLNENGLVPLYDYEANAKPKLEADLKKLKTLSSSIQDLAKRVKGTVREKMLVEVGGSGEKYYVPSAELIEIFKKSGSPDPKEVARIARELKQNPDEVAKRLKFQLINDEIKTIYGVKLALQDVESLRNAINIGDNFTAPLLIPERVINDFSSSTSVLSADFVGAGAENIYETLKNIVAASDVDDAILKSREAEKTVTERINAKKEVFISTIKMLFYKATAEQKAFINKILNDSIKFSGDDGLFLLPDKIFESNIFRDDQKRYLIDQLASYHEGPGKFRITFLPDKYSDGVRIPDNERSRLITLAENTEKNIRKKLKNSATKEIINSSMIAIDFKPNDPKVANREGSGSVKIMISMPKDVHTLEPKTQWTSSMIKDLQYAVSKEIGARYKVEIDFGDHQPEFAPDIDMQLKNAIDFLGHRTDLSPEVREKNIKVLKDFSNATNGGRDAPAALKRAITVAHEVGIDGDGPFSTSEIKEKVKIAAQGGADKDLRDAGILSGLLGDPERVRAGLRFPKNGEPIKVGALKPKEIAPMDLDFEDGPPVSELPPSSKQVNQRIATLAQGSKKITLGNEALSFDDVRLDPKDPNKVQLGSKLGKPGSIVLETISVDRFLKSEIKSNSPTTLTINKNIAPVVSQSGKSLFYSLSDGYTILVKEGHPVHYSHNRIGSGEIVDTRVRNDRVVYEFEDGSSLVSYPGGRSELVEKNGTRHELPESLIRFNFSPTLPEIKVDDSPSSQPRSKPVSLPKELQDRFDRGHRFLNSRTKPIHDFPGKPLSVEKVKILNNELNFLEKNATNRQIAAIEDAHNVDYDEEAPFKERKEKIEQKRKILIDAGLTPLQAQALLRSGVCGNLKTAVELLGEINTSDRNPRQMVVIGSSNSSNSSVPQFTDSLKLADQSKVFLNPTKAVEARQGKIWVDQFSKVWVNTDHGYIEQPKLIYSRQLDKVITSNGVVMWKGVDVFRNQELSPLINPPGMVRVTELPKLSSEYYYIGSDGILYNVDGKVKEHLGKALMDSNKNIFYLNDNGELIAAYPKQVSADIKIYFEENAKVAPLELEESANKPSLKLGVEPIKPVSINFAPEKTPKKRAPVYVGPSVAEPQVSQNVMMPPPSSIENQAFSKRVTEKMKGLNHFDNWVVRTKDGNTYIGRIVPYDLVKQTTGVEGVRIVGHQVDVVNSFSADILPTADFLNSKIQPASAKLRNGQVVDVLGSDKSFISFEDGLHHSQIAIVKEIETDSLGANQLVVDVYDLKTKRFIKNQKLNQKEQSTVRVSSSAKSTIENPFNSPIASTVIGPSSTSRENYLKNRKQWVSTFFSDINGVRATENRYGFFQDPNVSEGGFTLYWNLKDVQYAEKRGRIFRDAKGSDLEHGRYNFVVTEDGDAVYGQVHDKLEFGVKHMHLANGKKVVSAGELFVDSNGKYSWNLESGTFMRGKSIAEQLRIRQLTQSFFNEEFGFLASEYSEKPIPISPEIPKSEWEILCKSLEFLASNKGSCGKIFQIK